MEKYTKKHLLFGVNNAGKSNVIKYDEIQEKLQGMCEEILFEVFCDSYALSYVGNEMSTVDIDGITVEQVNKCLSYIKMQYRDKRSSQLITTTPDTVFKKMHEFIPILPEDASKWSFCLPSIYYHALTDQIKSQMHNLMTMLSRNQLPYLLS